MSKAPKPPPLPTEGGCYVLSKDGKRWDADEETTSPTALIEAPTDAIDTESPDPGEG